MNKSMKITHDSIQISAGRELFISVGGKRCQSTDQHENVSSRKALVDHIYDGLDASTYLLRGVAMVVSPHPQHHHLYDRGTKGPSSQLCDHFSDNVHRIKIRTLGEMWSSSPLVSLHRTCWVASPPTPKFRVWSGENSFLHTWRNKQTQINNQQQSRDGTVMCFNDKMQHKSNWLHNHALHGSVWCTFWIRHNTVKSVRSEHIHQLVV